MSAEAKTALCAEHKVPVESFDKQKKTFCCPQCQGNAADSVPYLDGVKIYREELAAVGTKAQVLLTDMQNAEATLEAALTELNANATREKAKLKRAFESLHASLAARETELTSQLESLEKRKAARLAQQLEEMKSSRASIEAAKKLAVEAGDSLTVSLTDLAKRVSSSSVEPQEDTTLEFVADALDVAGFGSVDGNNAPSARSMVSGPASGFPFVKGLAPAVFTIAARDRRGRPIAAGGEQWQVELKNGEARVEDKKDGTYTVTCSVSADCDLNVRLKGKHIKGSPLPVQVIAQPVREFGVSGNGKGELSDSLSDLTVEGDEVYVADSGNDRISVFRRDGTFVRMFGGAGEGPGKLATPCAVVISGGEVFVLESYNYRIQVFTPEGKHVRMIGSKGTGDGEFDGPGGFAISPDGRQVVVSDGHSGIQLFTREGAFVRSFKSEGYSVNEFRYPKHLAFSANGQEIYVASFGSYRVVVLRLDGTVVRSWGGKGSNPGQFDGLYCVTPRNGLVYTAEMTNNRLQVFQEDGTLVRVLELGALTRLGGPVAVRVTEEGDIWMAEYRGKIQMFR